MTQQILSSCSKGTKIRFKGCGLQINTLGIVECINCAIKDCKISGNYDSDGWRYDEIESNSTGNYIVTKQQLRVNWSVLDFYTFIPPEEPLELPL
jgi:hypothetical protein